MWLNLKLKALISIIILAIIVFAIKADKDAGFVAPTVEHAMRESGLEQRALRVMDRYLENRFFEPMPVMNEQLPLQLPCQFSTVLKPYGWNWDPVSNQQVFHPGILLQVQENTMVQAIAGGQVTAVGETEKGFAVTVKHQEDFHSYYNGLKEVLVEEGDNLSLVKPVGRSKSELYFELRDNQGAVDPQTVFQK